jgi:capsular exopolysaccharide synthesis family protein
MTDLIPRPSRAVVHTAANQRVPGTEAPYLVQREPGWESVRAVLGLFRRHIWLIAIITALAVGVAAWLVTREVTLYQASAVIRLIDRQPGVGGGTVTEAPLMNVNPVQSELVVLTGRTVLGQAVDREGFRLFSASTNTPAGLVEDAEVTLAPDQIGTIHLEFGENEIAFGPSDDRRRAAYGDTIRLEGARFVVPSPPREKNATLRVVSRDAAIDYLQSNLTPTPDPTTSGVHVVVTSTEPRIAPRAVNTIIEVYQEVNVDMARQNVRRRREFLEEQLRTTDSLLMVAQTGLSSMRSREQSYSAAGKFTVEAGHLMQVEMQQAQMQADLRMSENVLNQVLQARNSGGDLSALMSYPGIAGNPVVSSLYSQVVSYRTERDAMLAGPWARAPTHPEVQRLNTLIASTEDRLIEAVRSNIASSRAQIAALGGLRGRALAKMSDLPRTEVQEVYLTQNLEALQFMANDLRDQYQGVRLEEAAEAGLVEIVQLSTRALPLRPNVWMKIMLGLVVGLMLGGGAAVAREMFDDSINTPQEIENILLVPNLAVIPEVSPYLLAPGSNGGGHPSDPGTEAYRILRTSLLFSQEGLKTLVVTSAAPGEGKTMTSVNLAAAYARQGLKVLLLECDLRRPSLGKYFDNSQETDLTDVLFESRDWRQAIQPTRLPGLHVLLAGRSIPRAAELLGGEEMKRLLADLSTEFDMVILDTSPLLVAADATVLGAIVDGVLLVVRATRTDRGAVEQAVHQLGLVGANIVGTVLNDPEGTASRYGNYYDYSAEYKK